MASSQRLTAHSLCAAQLPSAERLTRLPRAGRLTSTLWAPSSPENFAEAVETIACASAAEPAGASTVTKPASEPLATSASEKIC